MCVYRVCEKIAARKKMRRAYFEGKGRDDDRDNDNDAASSDDDEAMVDMCDFILEDGSYCPNSSLAPGTSTPLTEQQRQRDARGFWYCPGCRLKLGTGTESVFVTELRFLFYRSKSDPTTLAPASVRALARNPCSTVMKAPPAL